LSYSFGSGFELLVQIGDLLGLGEYRIGQSFEEQDLGGGCPSGAMDDGDELLMEVVSGEVSDCLSYGAELFCEFLNVSGR